MARPRSNQSSTRRNAPNAWARDSDWDTSQSEKSKSSPSTTLRSLLTVIAALLAFGLVFQLSVTIFAYYRARSLMNSEANPVVVEKVYLQDFYQTYGFRAKSKAEADEYIAQTKLDEIQRREAEVEKRRRHAVEVERARFDEESRRIADNVSSDLRRAEAQNLYQRQAELRRVEEAKIAAKQAEADRIEREAARWRR